MKDRDSEIDYKEELPMDEKAPDPDYVDSKEISENNDEKNEEEQIKTDPGAAPVNYYKLFRFSTGFEKFIIFIGIVAAVASGLAAPIMSTFFGNLMDSFVDQALAHGMKTTPWQNTDYKKQIEEAFKLANATKELDSVTTMWQLLFLDLGGIPVWKLIHMQDPNYYPTDAEFTASISDFGLKLTIVGISQLLLGYVMVVCLTVCSERQILRIRNMFLKSILKQDISWYDTRPSGDFASRSTEDVDKVLDGIGEKLGMFILFAATFVFSVINAFINGWKLTLVMLAVFPLLAIAMAVIAKVQTTYTEQELQAYANAGSLAEEVLSAIRTVVAFGGEQNESKQYCKRLVTAKQSGLKKTVITALGSGMVWLIIYGSNALAFWYGVKLIIDSRNELHPEYKAGNMIVIFFGLMMGAMSLGRTAPYFESFGAARAAAGHVFMIIDRVPEIDSSSELGVKPGRMNGVVQFKNVNFAYPSRPDVQVLHGLTFRVNKGEKVALVGSSGCGKSTCIQLIQRFYDPHLGEVKIDEVDIRELNIGWLRDHIGVVGQEPVLFGTTIKENIRYGREGATDEEIIKAAKEANAHDFISKLPKKYETLVGERGTQLSGGQKQRIAIARALVRNPAILLLDEATSALDNQSESVVQAALDKASTGRTTLIVAHRLSTIRNADRIVAIKDGVVMEIGTHDELIAKRGLYYELVTSQVRDDEEVDDADVDSVDEVELYDGPLKRVISINSVSSEKEMMNRQLSILDNKRDSIKIDDDEDVLKPSMLKIIRVNKKEWPFLLFGVLGAAAMGFATPIYSLLFGNVMGILADEPDQARSESVQYAILFVVVGVCSFIASCVQIGSLGIAGTILTTRLREMTFTAILRQEISWFDDPRHSTGALCNKLSSDASAVQGASGTRIATILQSFITLAAAVIIALTIQWKLALVVCSSIPLVLLATYMQGKIITGQSISQASSIESASKIAIEAISNIRTVASLRKEDTFHQDYMKELSYPHRLSVTRSHVRGVVFGFAQSIGNLVYAGAMYYGGYLIVAESVSYAAVMKVCQLIMMGTGMTGQALSFTPDYNKALVSAARLFKILERKPEIDSYDLAHKILGKDCTGTVTFKSVQFKYPQRPKVSVLQGLSLDIKEGQTVALVGSSGCGKSTCIQLLERFYDAIDGELEYSSVDIRELNLRWLRSQLGLVSQEPVLFARTIRENIAYGDNTREVGMEEIIDASKRANIHNFISNLPLGYETQVGDKGTQLSGGQKQRVAIARALVRNPKILLLDEATSALDTESEKIVQDALDRARNGRTCITIAHRLSTIQNADLIAVIHHGRVVEQGTHAQLLSIRGHYYNLYKKQA